MGGRGGRSICRWTGNEDFQYSILRFWKKNGRETVFSTLPVITKKINEKSGFQIIKNDISIFGHLVKKTLTLVSFLEHFEDF